MLKCYLRCCYLYLLVYMSVFVDVEFEMVWVDGCIVVRSMVFYPNFLARHP